jgi:hypothetical protein
MHSIALSPGKRHWKAKINYKSRNSIIKSCSSWNQSGLSYSYSMWNRENDWDHRLSNGENKEPEWEHGEEEKRKHQ